MRVLARNPRAHAKAGKHGTDVVAAGAADVNCNGGRDIFRL